MQSKIRILFPIEAADQWIFEAYKGFFNSLTQGPYEIFCTACGINEKEELLGKYNVIDYARISHNGLNLLAYGLCSMTPEELIKQARQASLSNSPERILKLLSLFNVALSLLQPDIVIVWNGMGDIRQMVKVVLLKLHIPFLYAEKGMLPNSWYIDEEGINPQCSLGGSSFEQTIDPEQKTRIEDYINGIAKSGSSAWQQPSRIAGAHTLREKLGVNHDSRLIFFPGQVDKDVNIIAFSPFQSVAQAVKLVLESLPQNTVLVVKVHPKSKKSSRTQLVQLAQHYRNIFIVNDVNIWDLIDISDLVISINSTVAFESLLRRKKVLLLGDSVISNVGLAEKVGSLNLKSTIQKYLDYPFESFADYHKILSFVKFLLDEYYIFRNCTSLPETILRNINKKIETTRDKIFTREELINMFYADSRIALKNEHKGISSTVRIKDSDSEKELHKRDLVPIKRTIRKDPQAIGHPKPAGQTNKVRKTDEEAIETCSLLLKQPETSPPHMVSVIVPTYNRPALLVKALESILNQTYQNFEIVVVNDAGQDVESVVRNLQTKQNIVYLAHDINKGPAAARNTGIRAAKGKYIAYLDDDDIYLPDHLETLYTALESIDYRIAYTDAYRARQGKVNGKYIVAERTIPYSFDVDHDQLLVRNLVPVLCVMHEKSCLDEVGYFDESLPTHEDWDLWIRMSKKFKFFHIKKVTAEVSWRTDGTTITSEQNTPFLRIAKIYEKYKNYVINKPHVIKQQKRYIQSLKQNCRETSLRSIEGDMLPASSKIQNNKSRTASIIIPVFNNVEYTKRCLKALIKNTPNNLYEVIIVNNGSTDGTEEVLKCLRGSMKIISNRENLGFAKACNQGAAAADGNYLVFLNNDTEVQLGWLEELIKVLESDPEVGAVGSKLLYPDGSVQHAGVVMLKIEDAVSLLPRHVFIQEPSNSNLVNVPMLFQAVTAACMAVRKSDFESVDGFDESYWNGSEDIDLCFKLTKAGKKIVYQPRSVVIHYESKSGKERNNGIKRNNKLLRERWATKIKPDVIISRKQVREGIAQIIQPYLKNNKAVSVSRSQYINALISWVEKFFVNNNQLPVEKLRFAIKTCTPSRQEKCWGDTWFANSLARAFVKLGHKCEVHFRDEWDQPDQGKVLDHISRKEWLSPKPAFGGHIDVAIHVKGRFRYTPKPYNFNIIWIISHPELHTIEEINQFDAVFCASKPYLEYIRNRVEIPCFYLPQATDEDAFKPVDSELPKDIDILFVGTNYYGNRRRKIIQDVLDTGKKYNLWVVGNFWHGLIDKEYYKAEYVNWHQLPALYSRAKIVLNDHHETMREFGFINNRTYDLAALKAFQISNYVKGMEELGIVTYKTPKDLAEKLDYFLKDENARKTIANINHERCRNFTFSNVAREMTSVVNKLFCNKKIKDNKLKSYNQGSLGNTIKLPESRQPKVSVIVSCYNSEKFLPECLDSITNQTMQEWELFLLDDGSTDGTPQIIEDYSQIDERIKPFFFQDNKGPYVRRNFAIEHAASDFIVIQDADDIMCPTKLQRLYNEISKDEGLTIVGSFFWKCLEEFKGCEFADKIELLISHEKIMQGYASVRYVCWHGSAIIRKQMFESIGLFDENPFGSDSFWLAKAAELARYSKEIKFKNIPECLTIKREHQLSQEGLLPVQDPRSRRAKFRIYWEQKLQEIRNKIQHDPSIDIKTELKNCKCCDYIQRYGHLFEQWESEPLGHDFLVTLVRRASAFFSNGRYVACIINLNSIEKMYPKIANKLKNFDLLRAKAYFALEKTEQSLKYLKSEIRNHSNTVAEQFRADNFKRQRHQERLMKDLKNDEHANIQANNIANRDIIARQVEQEQLRRNRYSSEVEPRISIIIPAYNANKYISKAIDSVLTQDYENFELIVVDDGSTDDTKKIVEAFPDNRIKYIYQENSGVASACNMGIRNSNGAFIIRLDADDMMAPGFIVTHTQEFEKHPEADLIYCDDYLIDEDDKPIRVIERPVYSNHKALIRDLFRYGFQIVPFRTCIKTSVFEEIGFFDEQLIIAEGYDMMLRFVKRGLNAHHLKGALYLRRLTDESFLRAETEEKARCHFDVIKRFIDTFSYNTLFPDVDWDKIAPERRQMHAKYLIGFTCVSLGQAYVRNNSPIYAKTAFSLANEQLRESLKMDPSNYRVQQLLQQCESSQARYERELCEAIG